MSLARSVPSDLHHSYLVSFLSVNTAFTGVEGVANVVCARRRVFAFIMLLLCIYDVEEFRSLHDAVETMKTIRRVRELMEPWARLDSTIASNMARVDDLLDLKGAIIQE